MENFICDNFFSFDIIDHSRKFNNFKNSFNFLIILLLLIMLSLLLFSLLFLLIIIPASSFIVYNYQVVKPCKS